MEQENRVAKDLKGRRRAGSGNQGGYPGDVVTDNFLVECKDTTKQQFVMNSAAIEKIKREAESVGKDWLMVFDTVGHRIAVMDYDTMLGLMELWQDAVRRGIRS